MADFPDTAPSAERTNAQTIIEVLPLGSPPWPTSDPFLFCVHHLDHYPAGNEQLGPDASLSGRSIGNDFAGVDGWRMYHGETVPGFPAHPHRGFETVTVARRGLIDHSDSLGAAARFGEGDTQWMTAGNGVVHSEMFPLVNRGTANTAELFQIWLNLPRADKMVDAHFAMLWHDDIPVVTYVDAAGLATEVTVVAGSLDGCVAPAPPPHSWAHDPDHDVAIWTIRLEAGATWELPAAATGTQASRALYFFDGDTLSIDDQSFEVGHRLTVSADKSARLSAGDQPVEVLLLQGQPIAEPVAQYGPFVLNDRAGIEQAFADYQATQFGGWPWPSSDPVHDRDAPRFARHADGTVERPPTNHVSDRPNCVHD